MAGKLPPHSDVGAPTPIPGELRAPPSPVDFAEVLAAALLAGGTYAGVAVSRVRLVTDDGNHRGVDLPEPAEAVADDGLTPTRRRIVAVLKAEARPVTLKVIRLRINRKGRGGKLGQDVKFLVAAGLIFLGGDEYTDDRTKFAAGP